VYGSRSVLDIHRRHSDGVVSIKYINPLTLASPLYNLQIFTAIVAVRAGVSGIVGSTCIGAKTS
jgi:hypothetical protein